MSPRTTSHDPGEPLDARQQAVLQVVVREHSLTGEPVSSGAVARIARLQVSSATIRNVMAELEHRGLLSQPHTSAGRVPTDAGYRAFVNYLVRAPRTVPATQAREINQALARNCGEIPGLLGEASRQLSNMSHQVGLVLSPALGQVVVERFEFVSLAPRRVLAVLVGRSGVLLNRTLLLDEPLTQVELEHSGRYLSDHFGGQTVPRILERLETRLHQERAAFDQLQAKSLELCRQAVSEVDDSEVFVEGASNLLESPEFSDLRVVRTLFKTLEEKRKLIDLLHRLLDDGGVQVVIGEENPLADLARCSIVASTYESNGRPLGTVGVVGPTRMQYSRVIPLVDYLARALTEYLSVPRIDLAAPTTHISRDEGGEIRSGEIMTKSETNEETVLDPIDDDEIEIVEVVGLEEDSPGASVIPDDDPDELVLALDSPDFLDEDSRSGIVAPRPAGMEEAPGCGVLPDVSDQERLLRIQADFENFKKRVEREAEDTRRQAAASLIGRILPVLDNFERALSVDPGTEINGDGLRQGIELIFRQMLDELRREGLEAISAVGQAFDPEIHDAVETESCSDYPADTVIEELLRGYTLRGRLLRPALVKVNVIRSDS